MNIKLKNKSNDEIIIEFTSKNVKIINDDANFNIKIKVSRNDFDFLSNENYTVSCEQNRVLFDGNLSDEEMLNEIEKSKEFFIKFPIIPMNNEMLNDFYSLSWFNKKTPAEKELEKIKYIDKHKKISNTSLFINDKEVDINSSIIQDKIIFIN